MKLSHPLVFFSFLGFSLAAPLHAADATTTEAASDITGFLITEAAHLIPEASHRLGGVATSLPASNPSFSTSTPSAATNLFPRPAGELGNRHIPIPLHAFPTVTGGWGRGTNKTGTVATPSTPTTSYPCTTTLPGYQQPWGPLVQDVCTWPVAGPTETQYIKCDALCSVAHYYPFFDHGPAVHCKTHVYATMTHTTTLCATSTTVSDLAKASAASSAYAQRMAAIRSAWIEFKHMAVVASNHLSGYIHRSGSHHPSGFTHSTAPLTGWRNAIDTCGSGVKDGWMPAVASKG